MNERLMTTTKMNVSVALKLSIARFLNSSALLVIVNDKAEEWFSNGSLVYDATVLLGFLAFFNPLYYSLNIWGIYRKIKIYFAKQSNPPKLTQREANALNEGPPVDVANNIANFMNLIMTCLFYSPIIP